MKKLLGIIVSALVACACAGPTEITNRSAAPSANKAAETKTSLISEAEVIAKEKQAWDAVRNKDFDSFRNIMASDGVYVSHHGVLDPAGTIKETKELDLTDLSFSDWKVLPIDKDAVVVTYTAHVQGRIEGQPLVATAVRGSTAWVNREGKWLAIYHQDSEAKPAPTSSARKEVKTSPNANPTPPTAATSADPIANEKIVWDALKNKNFDAFAALLASDSLEVETQGVYDKAGSVKGVRETDLSKAVLSDWKPLKINDTAALVTYMVKGPGVDPSGEHHTTIWVNRDGKWLALFHQGTPVLKEVQRVPEKNSSAATKPAVKY